MPRMFNVDVTWQATTLMHHLDPFLRRKKNKNKPKIGERKSLEKREQKSNKEEKEKKANKYEKGRKEERCRS